MENKMDCVKDMVEKFNMVSESLLSRVFNDNVDDWVELTKYGVGDNVVLDNGINATVESININEGTAIVSLDYSEEKDDKIEINIDEAQQEFDSMFPAWSTLFNPNDNFISEWIENHPYEVSDCGFRIFMDNETGEIYLGVDGAGYDFYEAHWVKLYDAMGLQWHDSEEAIEKQKEFDKRCAFVNGEMRVFTDDGYIVVRPNTDPDYPGISVNLYSKNTDNSIENGGNINETPLVLIEKDGEENSYVTRVWGDDLQEDYTNKITHEIHLK